MESLLLLHGALGSKEQFEKLVPKLENNFDLHLLDFEGHGMAGPTDSPFRIEYFMENVLGYLNEHDISKANIFGYSMGGYVALMLIKECPDRIKRVATLGTILNWNTEVADRECRYLHPGKIKEKVPHFAEKLNNRHQSGWERVVNRTRELLEYLGARPPIEMKEWKNFNVPIRFHVGDRDTTAGVDETIQIYNKIDKASLCILPASDHPIEEVKQKILVSSLLDYFKTGTWSTDNGIPTPF